MRKPARSKGEKHAYFVRVSAFVQPDLQLTLRNNDVCQFSAFAFALFGEKLHNDYLFLSAKQQ